VYFILRVVMGVEIFSLTVRTSPAGRRASFIRVSLSPPLPDNARRGHRGVFRRSSRPVVCSFAQLPAWARPCVPAHLAVSFGL